MAGAVAKACVCTYERVRVCVGATEFWLPCDDSCTQQVSFLLHRHFLHSAEQIMPTMVVANNRKSPENEPRQIRSSIGYTSDLSVNLCTCYSWFSRDILPLRKFIHAVSAPCPWKYVFCPVKVHFLPSP